jgi:hypothetical protein
LVAVAALSFAVSANKANRAAKARAELAATAKSGINPSVLSDKQRNAPTAAVITATLSDNVTAATKVAPGGTINYTAVISNTGAASPADDATSLQYSGPLDANTTLVAGSAHVSPIAVNETYNWIGNTLLDSNARGLPSVTANDVAVNAGGADTFTVTAIAGGPTALGGTVTLASPSGAFTYTPPLGRPNLADGASVNDSFTYTITNSADPTLTSVGTVTITLTGRVWYLQAGAAGDGRSGTPSSSPSAMSTAADKSSDIFYIFANAAALSGPFSVDAGQQLLGQGVNLVVNIPTLGSVTLFTAAAPVPSTTNGAGNCVTLAGAPGNNTLSGFNIGNCSTFGIQGANVGTLTVSTLSINNTTGGGLDLTGVGGPSVNVVLGGLTSTGGTLNVRLVGLNGTVTLASGALSGSTAGATNHAFAVSGGGAAAITYSGSITKANQGNVVNISGRTGGTITLSGTISGSGSNGINVSSNTGGTIDFSGATKTLNTATNAAVTLATNTGSIINFSGGGLDIDTTSGAGFNATGGGTISVTTGANPNTIDTTTGTALNVANTTIGGGGLSFRSISSNGAPNGINLNTTGAGALSVTGNGGACTLATQTCTGGSIQSSTAEGIVLNSANALNLTLMKVQNSGTDGIHMTGGSGFTLTNSIVTDTAGITQQDGIEFDNVGGTITLTSIAVSGSPHDNIDFDNNSTNLTAFNLTGSTIQNTLAGTGADGILFVARGTSVITAATLTGNTISGSQSTGIQPVAQDTANIQNFIIGQPGAGNGNTINGNNAGVDANQSQSGNITFRVVNNTFNTQRSQVINAFAATASTGGTMTGFISSNTIGTVGVVDSGSAIGSGVRVISKGACVGAFTIDSNLVREVPNGRGIEVTAFRTAAGNGGARVKVTNNTVARPTDSAQVICGPADPCPLASIWVSADNETAAGNETTCSTVSGNTAYDPTSWANGGESAYYLQENNFTGPATHNLEGTMGTPLAQITNTNTVTNPGPGADVIIDGAVALVGVGTCGAFPTAVQPVDDKARNRVDQGPASFMATTQVATAQPSTELSKRAIVATPVVQLAAKDGIASVLAKTTPKATAAEVARIYRSEKTLSHHSARSRFIPLSQEPNAPTSGETITLNAAITLPAGKSITMKYSATVNTPPLARQVSTQGTVTANGGINVLTDDPEPAGGPQATVTLVDTLMTWNGVTSTDWNTATNWTQPAGGTQYAPGVSNPAVNDVVIPNVGNQPAISATDIGIFSLNLANGRTLTITSPRVLTIGGSPGGDLTLDGIISGGNLNLGTGTHVINNAGGTGSLSSTNVATVLSGGTVTLNNNLQAGAVAVNAGGSMNITGRTLSLNGSGAALVVPGGATFTTATSTVIFNGTAAQQAAGIAYNNLTINNTIGLNVTGVTLTGNAIINGALALTSSDLDTGAFVLSQPNTTASTGVSDVVGTITRTAAFGTTTITFGNPNNQITFGAAGTKPTALTVVMAKVAPATYAAAVQRNYTISQTGTNTSTAVVRLHYLDSELNGNTPETSLGLRRLRTGDAHWVAAPPPPGVPTRDGTANWIEGPGVAGTDLPTQWTFSTLAPTASGGTVTGRIVDDHGLPVEGAVVRLQGAQNRKFITDANGFYRFENVPTAGFYTVTPSRVNYSFNPATRSFTQLGESTDAGFGATLAESNFQNPMDTPEYFVRQHYVDFLGREPDEAGFNFWSDQIIECGGDAVCTSRRRENGSAAFFLSIEFQRTGGLVDKLYRASYGVAPQYSAFMPDTRTVGMGVQVGREGWEALLRANTEAFVNSFVNRPAFHQVYDGMADSLFVDTLIGHTGVSFTSAERDALVGGLGAGQMTRAEALRSIAENSRFVNAKFNETFVMMEYMGYLRRDPDAGGFAFWLNKLNEHNGNFEQAEMVKAFIVSGEYRDRFPR